MKNIIYECIICKKFQDTGLKDCKRCFLDMAIIKNERVNKGQCPYYKVCDICFCKGKLIFKDFFLVKRNKEERSIYWNYHKYNKKEEDIHNYWNIISKNIDMNC
jgi:hypothetical protein